MKSRILFIFLTALALLLLLQPAANAQSPTPSDDDVNAVARQLYCPVCENTPLDVCPTQACARWRDLIREKLAIGWTQKQVIDYFVAQYGDSVLSAPPAQGLHWLVYILPPVVFLIGVGILYNTLRKARRPLQAEPFTPPGDDYTRQVEEAFKTKG